MVGKMILEDFTVFVSLILFYSHLLILNLYILNTQACRLHKDRNRSMLILNHYNYVCAMHKSLFDLLIRGLSKMVSPAFREESHFFLKTVKIPLAKRDYQNR